MNNLREVIIRAVAEQMRDPLYSVDEIIEMRGHLLRRTADSILTALKEAGYMVVPVEASDESQISDEEIDAAIRHGFGDKTADELKLDALNSTNQESEDARA